MVLHRHPGKYMYPKPKGGYVLKKRPIHKMVSKKKAKSSKRFVGYKGPYRMSRKHREIFQAMDKKPFEVGGYMDFNKKGLERADVYMGRKGSVDIEVTPDKEVDYHTHPMAEDKVIDRLSSFPSKWDVATFKDYPSQTMMIFHGGKVMMATKDEKFSAGGKKLDRLYSRLNKDSEKMGTDHLVKKYKPEYKKIGLDINFVKHDKAIKVPIIAVEPIDKKQKVSKFGMFGDNDTDRVNSIFTKEGRYLFPREEEWD